MKPYDLLQALRRQPWALMPERLTELAALVGRAVAGEITTEKLAQMLARPDAKRSQQGVIAVLPIYGFMAKRDSWWGSIGTATMLTALQAAAADGAVEGIILDIDSPGGAVYGTPELADAVYQARQAKPVWAVANSLAASAAYWVGSQASKFFAAPSGDVGSIGVWMAHVDVSKMLENVGWNVTLISAGKYKVEGNPYEPLSDEAQAALQATVDETYGQFVDAVARGRGVSAKDVRSGMGEGRVVTARQALEMAMIDQIATFEEVVSLMQREIGGAAAGRGRAAEAGAVPEPHAAGAAAADDHTDVEAADSASDGSDDESRNPQDERERLALEVDLLKLK